MKNNKIQPKAVQGTAMANAEKTAEKTTSNALVILKPSEPSPEDLKTENERLKRILDSVPSDLSERINYYQQKTDWIIKLDKIRKQKDNLLNIDFKVKEELENDEYFTENFCISILKTQRYSKEETLLNIDNPILVGVVIKEVLKVMNEKIDELEINIAS